MKNSEYPQLVTDLSRDLVAQIAPEELPLFRTISEEYSKNPARTLRVHQGKDEDLGFGLSEATVLVTPIVLDVVKAVIKYLVGEIKKSIQKESPEATESRIKLLFKKFAISKDKREPKPPVETAPSQPLQQPPGLTTEQLRQVHRLAFEKARQLSLTENQAGLLADSIVGSLTITS
jgi:hypothetical protein